MATRTRKFLVGLIGGMLVASIGTAASASAFASHPETLHYGIVGVFLGLWIGACCMSMLCQSPRSAWHTLFNLAGIFALALPIAWYSFAQFTAAHQPDSLFALSSDTILLAVTVVSIPLTLLLFAVGWVIDSRRA